MAGVTSEGFVRKTQQEIIAEFQEAERENIDPLIEYAEDDILGQFNGIVSAPIAELWEVAEEVYHSNDRDAAEGDALANIGSILGVRQGEASRSTVLCTMNVDLADVVPAGSIIAVDGNEQVRFTLVEDYTGTGGAETGVAFESEELGAIQALAGTLTVIVSSVPGWNSVTNPEDAEPGDEVQTTAAFRQAIRDATTRQGGSTADAIRADVLALNDELDGTPVISCSVFENLGSTVDENGLPPRSIEVLVHAPTVTDAEIAERIWRTKPAGITTYGNDSATVTDENDTEQVVLFSRPTAVPIELDITLEVLTDEYAGDEDVQEYIVTQARLRYGQSKDVAEAYLKGLPFAVAGVYNVSAFTMNIQGDSPLSNVIPIGLREIADWDTALITVATSVWVDQ
jgi:uncharacterized phage protein gp47/JayE